jgi:trehalose 6-phosphate synthase
MGYERFLHDNPDFHRNVVMLQVAPLSRGDVDTYQEIRARLDALSGRINGVYADADWAPVRYVNRNYRRDELAGIYRAGSVGLVTPLRDGMNLVAKEYVASQPADDPGVLVLSCFAGAARELGEAVIVNPFDIEGMAEAILQGLNMPLGERKERWTAMMKVIERNDITAWRESFVRALSASDVRR